MITLRLVRASDAEALFQLIYQTGVTDTLLWDGPESLEDYCQAIARRAEQARQGEIPFFTIVESEKGLPVGTASLRPDEQNFRATAGLWIGIPFHGRGYGTQVIRWLAVYGFERLHVEKLDGEVFVGNWASRRVFEKNGFLLEGTIRKAVKKRGLALDEWRLGLTNEEYTLIQKEWNVQITKPDWLLGHLCERQVWEASREAGLYRALSLEQVGFIHASRPSQILGVANRFYRAAVPLVVLWIDPARLRAEVEWEPADGQTFPHLYGEINLDAVLGVAELPVDADGSYTRLPGIGSLNRE